MKYPSIIKIINCTNSKSINNLLEDKGKIYTFLNPVTYLDSLKHIDLYNEFNGIFADGSILVKFINFFYACQIKRVSFDMTSLAPVLFTYAIQNNKSIYIIASKQHEIENAVRIILEKFPTLNIIGYRNGYFTSPDELDAEIIKINTLNPDFLIIGMGVINQEKVLLKFKQHNFKGIGFTCGGFIHQTSKNFITYYPEWIDKWNCRFIYRMYKEKHTRKRYIKASIKFPLLFIYEKIKTVFYQ